MGVGADLEPGTLLLAYRRGLFPMGLGRRGARPIGWWSPDPRGILPLERFHVSRSLRRSMRRFEIRVDTAFDRVVAGCADPGRDGRWITPSVAGAYRELHRLGWAHSVESWADGELAGGLYGVAIGGLFAGESMYSARHRRFEGRAGRPRRPPRVRPGGELPNGARREVRAAAGRAVAHRPPGPAGRGRGAPDRLSAPAGPGAGAAVAGRSDVRLGPVKRSAGTGPRSAPPAAAAGGLWSRVAPSSAVFWKVSSVRAGSMTRSRVIGATGAATACVFLLSGCSNALSRGFLPKARDRERQAGHQPVERLLDRRAGRGRPGVGPDPVVRRGLPPPQGRPGVPGAAALQRADRDPLHRRAAVHDRRAVLLHRPGRDRPCCRRTVKPDVVVNVVGKQWSWDFNYTTEQVYEAGTQAELTGKPLPEGVAADALPAGRQAGRVRAHLARRHPLVLGAGLPAEARHDPRAGSTGSRSCPRPRARSPGGAPSCAARTTRRCCSR